MEIDINLSKQEICNDVAAELNLLGRTMELSVKADDKVSTNLKELANLIRTPDDNETKPIVARSMQEGWAGVKRTCQRYNAFGRKSDDNRLEAIVLTETVDHIIPDSIFDEHPGHQVPIYYLGKVVELKSDTTYNITLNMAGLANSPGKYMLRVGTHNIGEVNLQAGMEPVALSYRHNSQSEGNAEFSLVKVDNSDSIEVDGIIQNILSYSYNYFDNYNLQLVMPSNFNISVTSTITMDAHRYIVDTIVAAVLKNQQQESYVKYLATANTAKENLLTDLQARNSFGRVQHDWM